LKSNVTDTRDIDSDSTDDQVNSDIAASTLFTALVSRTTNTTDYITNATTSNTSSVGSKKRSIESKSNETKKKQNKNEEIVSDSVLVANFNERKNEHRLFIPSIDVPKVYLYSFLIYLFNSIYS